MPLRESESIVLKTYNLAEADRIVVLFTREFGTVRAVAKGARRLKSKFGSTLEPFSEVNIEYFEKEDRELVSLQNADLIRSSFDAAADPASLDTYSYIADLLITFAPPHDPNETLYRMVRAVLSVSLKIAEDHEKLKLYSEIWVLKLGGLLPEWTHCVSCKRSFDAAESATLSEGFHLICGTCLRGPRHGEEISPSHRTVLADAQRLSPSDFVSDAGPSGVIVSELCPVFGRVIAAATGKPLSRAQES